MKNGKKKIKAAVCAVLFIALLFDACILTKAVFGILTQKRDNPVYFSECLSPSFDAEKSEAVTNELAVLTEKALTYAAMQDDITLFENVPYVLSEFDRAEKMNRREKADTLYFAAEQIKSGTVSADMTENGFIVLSETNEGGTPVVSEGHTRYAQIDEKRIDDYFAAQLSSRQEEIRLTCSTAYREAKDYLDSLRNVTYAVRTGTQTISNKDLTLPDDSTTINQSTNNCIYVKAGTDAVAQSSGAITQSQKSAVEKAVGEYGKSAEIFLQFDSSMLFTEALQSAGQLHDECRNAVTKNIGIGVLSAVAAVVLLIFITALCPVSGQKKKRIAAAIVLAAVGAAAVALAVSLLPGSIRLFMNPSLNTDWLTVDSGTIVTKACLRICLLFTGLSSLAVAAKSALRSRAEK